MKITKRKIIIFIVLAALGGGGFLAWRTLGKGSQEPSYTTTQVEKGRIISTVSTSGNLTQTNTFTVTVEVTGVVKSVLVKDGEQVEKGQKLVEVTLDQSGEQVRAKSWSSYLSAKSAVASAEENKLSLEKGVEDAKEALDSERRSAELSLEIAQQKYERADEAIDKAKLDLNSAWISYQLTLPIITAPQSGKVSDISVVPGIVLSSSTSGDQTNQTGGSQKILTIIGEQRPLVSAPVNEIDIGKIAVEQKVSLTFDALFDKTFTGKVVGIDRTGTQTQGVVTYSVLIQLDTGEDLLYPNMTATAEIIIEAKENVLWVPPSAVRTQAGQTIVRVLVDGEPQEKPIEVGLETSSQVEIVSGLSEGETVVVGEQAVGEEAPTFGGDGGFMRMMR